MAASVVLASAGCTADVGEPAEVGFREVALDEDEVDSIRVFWGAQASTTGDPVFELVDDLDGQGAPVIDIFDFSGAHLLRGTSSSIMTASGQMACSFVGDAHTLRLVDNTTKVVLYTIGSLDSRRVFNGLVDPNDFGWANRKVLRQNINHSYVRAQVFAGMAWHRDILVTATQSLQALSMHHKLMLTAALDGQCGA